MKNKKSKKVVLVVGSAKGLGKYLAQQFVRSGMTTIFHYREKRKGLRRGAVFFDVRENSEVEREIRKIIKKHKHLDLVVNCVGPYTPKRLDKISIQDWKENIEATLHGAFFVSRAVLPHLRRQKSGCLVFIGDAATGKLKTSPMAVPYKIAKNGLITFVYALREVERKRGIKVGLIAPGYMPNSIVSPPKKTPPEMRTSFDQVWKKLCRFYSSSLN